MAAPFLAPVASLMPVLKVLALGSIKFVGIGIGAAVAPVTTANFLVGLSAGTPLKYAKYRHRKGHFSDDQMDVIATANQLVENSLVEPDSHLSRAEAREFLKEILVATMVGMRVSLFSIPKRLASGYRAVIAFFKKVFSSRG